MKQPPPITDAEWAIMQLLWKRAPLNSQEIADQTDLHPQTAKTYLSRLVKKGALTYHKEGRFFLYSPAFSEAECQRHESRSFLDRVFGGSLKPMLSHLVEDDALNEDELKELRKILDQKKNSSRS